jgi:hypothetical protein
MNCKPSQQRNCQLIICDKFCGMSKLNEQVELPSCRHCGGMRRLNALALLAPSRDPLRLADKNSRAQGLIWYMVWIANRFGACGSLREGAGLCFCAGHRAPSQPEGD